VALSGTFVTAFPESSVPKSGAYNTIIHHTHNAQQHVHQHSSSPISMGHREQRKIQERFFILFFAIVSFANKAKIVHLKLQSCKIEIAKKNKKIQISIDL
jgi:hypothetical protein